MSCDEYKLWIQEFHDHELAKSKEPMVFTHLSECQDCRDFFKGMNLLNATVHKEIIDFPLDLDERIMRSIAHKEQSGTSFITQRIPAFISYSLGVIIVLMFFYFINSTNEYKNELRTAASIMKEQNQQLKLIMNSYPEVEIKTTIPYNVIVQ